MNGDSQIAIDEFTKYFRAKHVFYDMATKLGPDLNRISSLIHGWRKGFVGFEEAERTIHILMQPENHVPESELRPEIDPNSSHGPSMSIMKRIEQKLNLTIKQMGVALPDELNPEILCSDAVAFADDNRKIQAVHAQCSQTGLGLADAKRLVEDYIRKRNA